MGAGSATAQSFEGFEPITPDDIEESYARVMSDEWALVSAGDSESFNTMTISWGTFGHLWRRDVVTIYIRASRFTHTFIEREDRVTITLFGGDCKSDMLYLGRHSGRDGDKLSKTKLKAIFTPSGLPTFEQAEIVIEGRKLYKSRFKEDDFIDKEFWRGIYTGEADDFHDCYILEIERVWRKVK